MYHVIASINGRGREFPIPEEYGGKHNAAGADEYARHAFSHSGCDYVAVADASGIVAYISRTGQVYS